MSGVLKMLINQIAFFLRRRNCHGGSSHVGCSSHQRLLYINVKEVYLIDTDAFTFIVILKWFFFFWDRCSLLLFYGIMFVKIETGVQVDFETLVSASNNMSFIFVYIIESRGILFIQTLSLRHLHRIKISSTFFTESTDIFFTEHDYSSADSLMLINGISLIFALCS